MKKILVAIWSLLLFMGCDDYLDVTPKGKLLPTTTQDFSEMMGDPSLPSAAYPIIEMMTDNCLMEEEDVSSSFTSSTTKAYLWQDEFYTKTEDDMLWTDAYGKIYTCNLVLERTDASTGGTEADKKRVKAEASFNRAYYYWLLHNSYAPAYSAETAASDMSVPLRLDTDLEVKLSQAMSDQVVKQLLEDIQHPEDLPQKASSVYHINRGGAYALCARIYLSIGDYENALKYAELALGENSELLDYNTYSFVNPDMPYSGINNRPEDEEDSPEVLMYRGTSFGSILSSCLISKDLMALYDQEHDLRWKFNYTFLERNGDLRETETPAILHDVAYSIGVPEMMLIKAECLARQHDRACLEVLDELRRHRFSTFTPLDVADDQLLQTVLDERRRELPFHGLRLFDMKRLAKEGIFTTIVTREVNGETYTLEPNSPKYLVPVSSKLISLNSNLLPNR